MAFTRALKSPSLSLHLLLLSINKVIPINGTIRSIPLLFTPTRHNTPTIPLHHFVSQQQSFKNVRTNPHLLPLLKSSPPSSRTSIRALPTLPIPTSTTSKTFLGLVLSTALGLQSDKTSSGHGILISMMVAGLLSNMKLMPSTHHLYDSCWSVILPTSLTLLLLSLPPSHKTTSSQSKPSMMISSLATPFLVASIGSLLGCLASYSLKLINPPSTAATAAGCLCATYIGGSLNFWSTARILGGSDDAVMTTMAASELLVMAGYFAVMANVPQWRVARRWFGEEGTAIDARQVTTTTDRVAEEEEEMMVPLSKWGGTLGALALLLFLSHSVSHVSWTLERLTRFPGLTCGVISVLTPLISRVLRSRAPRGTDYMFSTLAPKLSNIYFHLLFAGIGAAANVTTTGGMFKNGVTTTLFSGIALLVHALVLTIWGGRRRRRRRDGNMTEILVASNAAIGGPATAALFAGRMGGEGLVRAASVWGVVGYAIGTGIGVGVARFLGGVR